MISAFGVDHGEVSKGWRLPGTPAFRGIKEAGVKTKDLFQGGATKLGNKMAQGTFNAGAKNMMSGAGRVSNPTAGKMGQRVGAAQMRGGTKMAQAGTQMARRPGLTGGVAIGAGGTAAGGGAYGANKKMKKQPGRV